jgi:hypothetical protein
VTYKVHDSEPQLILDSDSWLTWVSIHRAQGTNQCLTDERWLKMLSEVLEAWLMREDGSRLGL